MYNLIEYSDTYLKISGSLWQFYRDEPALDNNGNVIDFLDDNNNSASFKFKPKITGKTGNGGRKDVEILVPLKYLSNFWRKLEIPLINCEIILQIKWLGNCIEVAWTVNNQNPAFQIIDTKLYVLVIILSTQENLTLLKQLEPGFKKTINWNKYLAKTTNQVQNRHLDYLIDPIFQGVNTSFVLAFEDDNGWESLKRYYLRTVEIKDMLWSMEEISLISQ